MARNENEKIDIDIVAPDDYNTVFYSYKGEESSEESSASFAKVRKNLTTGHSTYYVKYGRGDLYDPWGMYQNKKNSPEWRFKKTTKSAFDLYVKYLADRREQNFVRAKRELLNG